MIPLIQLTYYEYTSRKTFIVSCLFYLFIILILFFGISKKSLFLINPHFLSFLFYFTIVILLLSSFDMITRMIEDGSIELALSSHLSKTKFLFFKYISILTVVPFASLLFYLVISIMFFVKNGYYDTIFLRVFIFAFLTFSIFYAYILPLSLFFCRSNLNLMLFFAMGMANAFPNIIKKLTFENVDLTHNPFIGFLYTISPRMVEMCGLSIDLDGDLLSLSLHFVISLSVSITLSLVILKRKDF